MLHQLQILHLYFSKQIQLLQVRRRLETRFVTSAEPEFHRMQHHALFAEQRSLEEPIVNASFSAPEVGRLHGQCQAFWQRSAKDQMQVTAVSKGKIFAMSD